MGICGSIDSTIPESIQKMSPSEKKPNVEIEYCGGWGGASEAEFTENFIRHVYPNGSYQVYSPGETGMLIVRVNG